MPKIKICPKCHGAGVVAIVEWCSICLGKGCISDKPTENDSEEGEEINVRDRWSFS